MEDFMRHLLGERIRHLRKLRGITQKDLAKGICTQAQVSNLERGTGNENPSSQVLYLLSERLQVDMSYLYGQYKTNYKNSTNQLEVKSVIDNLKSRRDYLSLKYVIDNELSAEKNKYISPFQKQYLYWHQAICAYHYSNDFNYAEKLINSALIMEVDQENEETHIQKIEIKVSYGLILYYEKVYDLATKLFLECIDEQKKFTSSQSKNKILPKILFNLSKCYTAQENYDKALSYCLEAIDICVENDSLYLLGDVIYQAGYNYYMLGQLEEALSHMNDALIIFNIQKNDNLVKFVKIKINELTAI